MNREYGAKKKINRKKFYTKQFLFCFFAFFSWKFLIFSQFKHVWCRKKHIIYEIYLIYGLICVRSKSRKKRTWEIFFEFMFSNNQANRIQTTLLDNEPEESQFKWTDHRQNDGRRGPNNHTEEKINQTCIDLKSWHRITNVVTYKTMIDASKCSGYHCHVMHIVLSLFHIEYVCVCT